MNRRSLLRLLGLAPMAAPMALTLPAAPNLPPIDYAGLTADVQDRVAGIIHRDEFNRNAGPAYRLELGTDGRSRFVIDAEAFYITSPKSLSV